MKRFTEKITKPDLWEYKVETNKNYRIGQGNDCVEICGDFINKLAEYEDAEENGTFVRLPCKVGGTVYTNFTRTGSYLRQKDRPHQCKVVYVGVNYMGSGEVNVKYANGDMWRFMFDDFGKIVFKTKEDAEKALKEMENQ